jgi:hypothetical protein
MGLPQASDIPPTQADVLRRCLLDDPMLREEQNLVIAFQKSARKGQTIFPLCPCESGSTVRTTEDDAIQRDSNDLVSIRYKIGDRTLKGIVYLLPGLATVHAAVDRASQPGDQDRRGCGDAGP